MANDTIGEQVSALVAKIRGVARNTHAGVAVVGASIVSEGLRRALLSRMRSISKTLQKRLFEGYGPLSSFAARIDLAFALDVIPAGVRADLEAIRAIRNAFAHSEKILHFDDPAIADRCRKLSTYDPKKPDLQLVYMAALQHIDKYLEEVVKTDRDTVPGATRSI